MSEHGMKMLGKVSRDYHQSSTWVKVSVPQIDGIPLSLKAHRGKFAKELFVKDRTVEITLSCKHSTYRYSVTEVYSTQQDWAEAEERVLEGLKGRLQETHPCVKYGCRKEATKESWEDEEVGCRRTTTAQRTARYFEESQEERMSFYIGSRYFGSQELRQKLKPVLREALDMTSVEADMHMQDYGFWVVCRASQFAKFLIYRDRAGICNGFIDLRAQLDLGSRTQTKQINVADRG